MIQNEKNKFEGNLELQENQKWRNCNVCAWKAKKSLKLFFESN